MTIELIVVACVMAAVLFTVRIAPDRVRFAVFAEGQFQTLKGPGLLVKLPRPGVEWVRLAIGDQGRLVSTGIADFDGRQIPVAVESGLDAPRIRITGFRGSLVAGAGF